MVGFIFRKYKVGGGIVLIGVGCHIVCNENRYLRSVIPDNSFWWTQHGLWAVIGILAILGVIAEVMFGHLADPTRCDEVREEKPKPKTVKPPKSRDLGEPPSDGRIRLR